MSEWWLKLLGIKNVGGGGNVADWHIHFTNLQTPLQKLLLLVAAIALVYGVWYFYRREPEYCTLKRRRVLAGLRYFGFLVLLLILSGPVLEVVLKGFVKGKVVVLVDTSKSMDRQDKYRRAEDKLVAAHVLGLLPLSETDPSRVSASMEKDIAGKSRIDLVRALLAHKDIRLLEDLQSRYDVELWSFARANDLKRLGVEQNKLDAGVLDHVPADGLLTEIGGSLRATINRLKGQPLSGIVLLTDGGNNKGEDPVSVAQDLPVRVFPVGIGVPQSHDVAIAHVFIDSKIFVDDLAPVYVRITQHGFNNEQAQITVSSEGQVLTQQTVTLKEIGEQTEIVRVKPKKPGKFTYTVEVQPLNHESEDCEPANNTKARDVEVIDQKLNVLLVESEPRWEYRFLKNSLLRDKRVSCKILLHVPDMAELAKSDPKVFLKEFPNREELFKFHAIIFGNVPNDGFLTEVDMENIRRFVLEEGGGIWFIAGKNGFPDTYKDSKLEILIPVEFDRNPEITADEEQQNPLIDPSRIILTPEGRIHSVTRLDMEEADRSDDKNAQLWEQMPGIYWFHRDTRAKLGSSPLLVTTDDKHLGGRAGDNALPLMVVNPHLGRGRVLYQSFADLWRMRYPLELGPDALERFHGHVVQYLGLPKLLGRTSRVEITVDHEEYSIGDRVKINAHVLTKKTLDYSTAEHVTALVTESDNEANQATVELTPIPGQRGEYQGEKLADTKGSFRVTLKDEGEDDAHADFSVVIPQVELDNPDMKKDVLDGVAKTSVKTGVKAGMYFADQAGQLLKDLNQAQKAVEEHKENTLWDAPILLILFALFLGLEWFLRKRSDLI